MSALPGIEGSLFPSRYLLDALAGSAATSSGHERFDLARRRRHLETWWQRVALTCGPATGLRALFDLVALPLAGALGFRTRDVSFERARARVRLESPDATPVGLVILPWATHRSAAWRDVVETARAMRAHWCFLLAPPFFSLVDARGHALRHSADFTLPDVFDHESFPRFWAIACARAFDAPAEIDALVAAAARFQDSVRTDLQDGVLEALAAFGRVLNPRAPVDEALTLVYRLLFLLFAESRDLVPRSHPIYGRAYAVGTLARAALEPVRADGLWHGLAAVTRLSRVGCRLDDLIVRPFNGRLFARSSAPSLETGPRRARPTPLTSLRDDAMQRALVALCTRRGRAGREHISYADLGVEQLGAVYERVLDVEPYVERTALHVGRNADRNSALATTTPYATRATRAHSLRRKQTGTFYTPQPLAEYVVRRTLAPLVCAASTDAILALRVVDPAMGSGAFLVAACRYLAAAYERALIDEGRCAATDLDDHERANIRRLIAERCLAGVDANPVAVQLARLSLWLTTLSRGKPLGFLDHRLRVGNSLVGASPADFGRLRSRRGRAGAAAAMLPLFEAAGLEDSMRLATRPLLDLATRPDDTVGDVRAKEAVWSRLAGAGSPLEPWRQAADLWCARWFTASPASPAELRAALDAILKGDTTLSGASLTRRLASARDAAGAHGFFHWPLEFADVFYDEIGRPRARAGFDAVIGNPPWEMLRNESRAKSDGTPGPPSDRAPALPSDGASGLQTRGSRQLMKFIRESGLYPSCDRGHLNLYQPFLERALSLTRPGGRAGLILPWGLAADDGAVALRQKLVDEAGLDTIVGLDNAGGLFPIHRGLRFAVIVANPGAGARGIRARFGVRTAAEIDELPDRDEAPDGTAYPIRLSGGRLRAIGGRMQRIPDVRHPLDLALLERLSLAHPALGDASGWGAEFGRELNATEDRASFGTRGLPVVEGKHLSPFVVDASAAACRIERRDARRLLPDLRFDRARLAYRDVSGVGNRVSLIAAVIPAGVVTTHTVFCLRTDVPLERQHFLCGLFNSYVLNAVVRLLMGGHVTTSLIESLPVPLWTGDAAQRRIGRLARERSQPYGELHAAVARLYGLDPEMFAHVLRGFPLVPIEERQRTLRAFSDSDRGDQL
jgi:hypothetical protein